MTLVVIHNDEQILLGLKKRGFGAGRWNGFGGKVDEGETVEQAAKRELQEEIGVEVTELVPRGELKFTFEDETADIEVPLFEAKTFTGQPTETEEMKPQWFAHADIPYNHMWADDPHWLPLFLQGKNINGHFHFDSPGSQNILNHTIEGI